MAATAVSNQHLGVVATAVLSLYCYAYSPLSASLLVASTPLYTPNSKRVASTRGQVQFQTIFHTAANSKRVFIPRPIPNEFSYRNQFQTSSIRHRSQFQPNVLGPIMRAGVVAHWGHPLGESNAQPLPSSVLLYLRHLCLYYFLLHEALRFRART
jgi:hypothetical protein